MTPRYRRRLGVIVGFALLLPMFGSSSVGAAPIDDKRAEAARLQDEIEKQSVQVSILAERFNAAQLKVGEVDQSLAKVQADVNRSDERLKLAKTRMAQAAIIAYVHGGSSSMLSSLARSQGDDMIVRRQYLRVTAADQHKIVGELRLAQQDLAIQTAELDSQKKAARLAAEEAGTASRLAASSEDAQRAVLGRVNGEISGLVAEEAARREAEEAARRTAVVQPPTQATAATPAPLAAAAKNAVAPVEEVVTKVVPSSGRGATAVAEARKQLGKPYRYGGSGPDSFDCSGLTSWAWRAAGVELSHSALTQYYETTRVSTSAVEPGDLLFFGGSVSGIHHVTMYIGGGEMIEASQTGTPIRIRGWRSGDLVGAGRPG